METRADKKRRLEKRKRDAELKVDLAGHGGVKLLVKELTSRVEGINNKLLYNVGMTKEERDLLFVERDCWNWLVYELDSSKTTLENTTKALEKYE